MNLTTLIEKHFSDVKSMGTKVEAPCKEGMCKIYRVGNVVRIDVKPPKEA